MFDIAKSLWKFSRQSAKKEIINKIEKDTLITAVKHNYPPIKLIIIGGKLWGKDINKAPLVHPWEHIYWN